MNIALPAIVIFLLALPGFVFRSRFKRAERLSLDHSPFGQVASEGVLWAMALHGLWLFAAWLLLDQRLEIAWLLKLMSTDAAGQTQTIDALAARQGRIATYLGSLYVFAVVAPTLAREAIIRARLDRSASRWSRLFRFNGAPWYYLLTDADFKTGEEPDLINISAIVDTAGKPVLYSGVLEDFFFDLDGRLDRLVLSNVLRRSFSTEESSEPGAPEPDFYTVKGDYFVLRYSEAITLNILYWRLEDQSVETAPASESALGTPRPS